MSHRPTDTRTHTHTRTLAAGFDEEGQDAGRQKTDAIREQDGCRGENCVLVLCVDMVEWIIFYVDRDFINFSAIKAPPGSTTEILFD